MSDPCPAPPPVPERTEPVTLPKRSPEAARAYHEGYAAALEQMAEWLRDKAHNAAVTASMHRAMANCHASPDPTADKPPVRDLYAAGLAEGRLRELEAVVAWLLRAPDVKAWRQDPMEATAAALLRGEHLCSPKFDPTADKAQLASLAGRR